MDKKKIDEAVEYAAATNQIEDFIITNDEKKNIVEALKTKSNEAKYLKKIIEGAKNNGKTK